MIRDRLNQAAEAVSGAANRAAAVVGEIATNTAEAVGDFADAAHREVQALKDKAAEPESVWAVVDGHGRTISIQTSVSRAEVLSVKANDTVNQFLNLPKDEKAGKIESFGDKLVELFPNVTDGAALMNGALRTLIINDGESTFHVEKFKLDV